MLTINELSIDLGSFHLNMNTKIHPGLTMLVGQNGSGKSTFLTGLTGFYDEKSGTVRDVNYNSKPLSHHTYAYLPQEMPRSLLSVKDFVELTTEKDSGEMLDIFHLTDLRDARIETLSGGEFKRAQLAQIILEDKLLHVENEV